VLVIVCENKLRASFGWFACRLPVHGLWLFRTITRRVGFRFVALVTADDSDPSKLDGVDGSGNFTMRMNVNGAKIWSRGANLIPMDEMDG
jgi:beta-galactosidase/beta-glucuronidase